MFLSKIINFLIIASLSTHVSEPHITTGIIIILYSLSLDRLVTNLFLEIFDLQNMICYQVRFFP
jgi:hypothetical protein